MPILDFCRTDIVIDNNRLSGYQNCLSLESIQYRFLLSGSIKGAISLFDFLSEEVGSGRTFIKAKGDSESIFFPYYSMSIYFAYYNRV